jgi:hypothetical protein
MTQAVKTENILNEEKNIKVSLATLFESDPSMRP